MYVYVCVHVYVSVCRCTTLFRVHLEVIRIYIFFTKDASHVVPRWNTHSTWHMIKQTNNTYPGIKL